MYKRQEQIKAQGYSIRCHRKDFLRLARLVRGPAIVFLDLPYSFWKPVPEAVGAFLAALPAEGEGDVILFLQGPEPYPGFEAASYGSTVLSWTIRRGSKKFDRIGV